MNTPVDMSIWHLVSHASFVVQLVMLVLIAASVWSWNIIFQRRTLYRSATQAADAFDTEFWSGGDFRGSVNAAFFKGPNGTRHNILEAEAFTGSPEASQPATSAAQ